MTEMLSEANALKIKTTEVQIFCLDTEHPVNDMNGLKQFLISNEIIRADKYKSGKDRSNFITGRAFLRKLIGAYLDTNPAEIILEFNKWGKPYVNPDQNKLNLKFNLSHSGDLIVYSFCQGDETGIDCEKINPELNHIELAASVFTEAETAYLNSTDRKEDMIEKFFRIWTRKEAVLKGLGTGISDLKRIDVLNDKISSDKDYLWEPWTVTDLNLHKDYKSAFASSGNPKIFRITHLPAELNLLI